MAVIPDIKNIPTKPDVTNTTSIQSTEGINLDLWRSLDLSSLLPKALQEIIDLITSMLDNAMATLEWALASARAAAAAAKEIFSLIRSILTSIRDKILALLDLFPLLEAGVYLLYIPTEMGGNDHYLNTFTKSLTDQSDLRRPPQDDRLLMHAMFLMWGAPWWDTAQQQFVQDTINAITTFFDTPPAGAPVSFLNIDVKIYNFDIEKGFYPKYKTTEEKKAVTIALPKDFLSTSEDDVQKTIKTSFNKISLTSQTAGVAYKISWNFPPSYGRFSLKASTYLTFHVTDKLQFNYQKVTNQIHGVFIIRSNNAAAVHEGIKTLKNTRHNNILKNLKVSSLSKLTIQSIKSSKPRNPIDLIIIPASVVTRNSFYLDYPEDTDNNEYYYATALVFTECSQMTSVYPNPKDKSTYSIIKTTQLNPNNYDTVPFKEDKDLIDAVDFTKVHPKDIPYKDLDTSDLDKLSVSVGTFTEIKGAYGTKISNHGGINGKTSWSSFKLFEDLLPVVKQFLEAVRTYVNALFDSLLDDIKYFEEWILSQIEKVEDAIQEAMDFIQMLRSLIFPPMAGVHYLPVSSKHGINGVAQRLKKSLSYALMPVEDSYNPLLLATDWQISNPAEYQRRKTIPAYDQHHVTGGLVIVFQEPAVKQFLEDVMGLATSFGEDFKKLLNDSRLRMRNIRVPELVFPSNVNYTYTYMDQQSTNPSEYMNQHSSQKAIGDDANSQAVNHNGNAEVTSEIKGPYENVTNTEDASTQTTVGEPLNFSVATEDGKYVSTIIPTGTLTAQQIVALLNTNHKKALATALEDGSFTIEGQHLQISPCSGKAAALLGLPPNLDVKVPVTPTFSSEQFSYDDGDYLVELQGEGPPTLEMIQSTPPILQLLPADLSILNTSTYQLRFNIEGQDHSIDVTGNSGNNPVNTTAQWQFDAVLPLKVEATNNKLKIKITTTTAVSSSYQHVSTDYNSALTELEQEDAFNKNFTNSLNRPTPSISTEVNEITIPPATYNTPYELGAAILGQLHGSKEVDQTTNQPYAPRLYPIGLLTVVPVSETSNTHRLSLKFLDTNAHNGDNTIEVTAPTTNSFFSITQNHQTVLGTTKQDYNLSDIVTRLNSYFTGNPFSIVNNSSTIRITGSKVGTGNKIIVNSSKTPIDDDSLSSQYSRTAAALFGVPIQTFDLEVEGIGDPPTTKLYHLDLIKQNMCINMEISNYYIVESINTEIDKYTIEIEDSKQQDYLIEL